MSDAPRRIALPLLALVAMATIVALVASSAPAVCGSCHAMAPYYSGQADTAHAGVSCYACHLQAGTWDFAAFKYAEVLGMYPHAKETTLTGPASRLSSAACLRCHRPVLDGPMSANGYRIDHRFCSPKDSCDGCHTAAAHPDAIRWQRSAEMDECIVCHIARTAPRACDTCHKKRTAKERLATAPWKDTHDAIWKSTHGLGSLRYCPTCHTADFCTKCHAMPAPRRSSATSPTPGGAE